MGYVIFTDTSANLPTKMTEEKEIQVIPFTYYIEDEEHTCLDTEAFDGTEYYGLMRKRVRMRTAQINPETYKTYMEPVLRAGQDILYVGMSSGISGSYSSSLLAAQQLREAFPEREIRTIDTLGTSLGEGLPVLRAVECRDAGMSLDETEKTVNAFCQKMYQIFIVDDLINLRQNGRLSNAAAVAGIVLRIKPLLKGNEKGQIVCIGKERGRKRAIAALAARYRALVKDADQQTVGIAHADCLEDAEDLAALLREAAPPKDILTVCYEPVTGSHVGAGTLALFFLSEDGVRYK